MLTVGDVLNHANATPAPRSISTIAEDIRKDWSRIGKGVNYAAKPYLEAMHECHRITEQYYHDSAESIVLYFLANATSYRGENAKRLKAELKAMLPKR